MSTIFGYMICNAKSPVCAVKLDTTGYVCPFLTKLHTEKQRLQILGNR